MDAITSLLRDSGAILTGVSGLLGLVIGSFLNVVIYRLPIMMERDWRRQCAELEEREIAEQPVFNLVVPPSACPDCRRRIRAYENIPVLSWLLLRGRCAGCSKPISPRYPLIELTTAILSAVIATYFGFSWETLAALLFTWTLIALTMIDYDRQWLPDNLTLPLLWAGLLLSLGHGAVDSQRLFVAPQSAIIGAAAGYLSLWGVFHLFRLVTGKEGMGYGDFKLLAALGAWLGWQALPLIVLLSAVVGAVVGVALIAFRRHQRGKPIPFGPFLAAAGWIALLWGDQLSSAYLAAVGL